MLQGGSRDVIGARKGMTPLQVLSSSGVWHGRSGAKGHTWMGGEESERGQFSLVRRVFLVPCIFFPW